MGRPLLESRINQSGSVQKKLSVSYTYFKDGTVNKLTYPSGDVITYGISGAGRLLSATDSGNNFATSATYFPSGLLSGMTNGSGIVSKNIYNNRLQGCRAKFRGVFPRWHPA
jgi:hypothetical protein